MADINWEAIREENLGEFTMAELPPTLKLPALPHAVTLFLQKSGEPDTSVKELSKIIETDTGLTLELLRFVNSSYVGLRHRANNVLQALSLLGMRQSKNFVVTTGMQAAVRARKSKLINQTCFWNASLQKAIFAKEVAVLLKADGDVAFAGALLQDYLLPIITNDLTDNYLQWIENRDALPENLCEYEREKSGWDHALAGACLAHRWHLPDDLVCCVLFHHYGLRILAHPQLSRSPVAAVALSALLPDQLRQEYHGLEQLVRLSEKWGSFDLQALAAAVDEKQEELGIGIRNDFPLTRRCRPILDEATFCDGTLNAAALQ